MSVYIPKPVLLGLLYAVACVVGWMLYESVAERASAKSLPPPALESSPAVANAAPNMSAVKVPSTAPNTPAVAVPAAAPNTPAVAVPAATPNTPAVAVPAAPTLATPGLPASSGYVATPGSTFSLTTGPGGSHAVDLAGIGDVAASTPGEVPAVAQAGPGGASYPLAVPSPTLSAPMSAPNPSPSSPAQTVQQPMNLTYPFPITYPGSFPIAYPAIYPITYPASYPVMYPSPNAFDAPEVGPLWVRGPASYIEPILAPLPGAQTRGIAFSEWESYRTDVAGRNIIATTDDSNVFVNRNGNLNGNTGDTDASGLNVTDATNSVIRGTESADEAPYQTIAAAIVDLASEDPGGGLGFDPDDDPDDEDDEDDDGDANDPDPGANGVNPHPLAVPVTPASTAPVSGTDDTGNTEPGDTEPGDTDTGDGVAAGAAPATPAPGASAAVVSPDGDDDSDSDDSQPEEFDFPYEEWTEQISGDAASAVHTDEGTTLASGADAVVVGADGYDDDDNRAVGENIVVTRDDSNVVLGGNGDVNAQIGDSEQGAVIMDVNGVFIQGGGAY